MRYAIGILAAALAVSQVHARVFPKKALKAFAATAASCLKKNEQGCLEKLFPKRAYFPDQDQFGCKTADTEQGWYITAEEFARCVRDRNRAFGGAAFARASSEGWRP